jgi:hypothetical protein
MLILHTTPRKNLASILERGLLRYSRGRGQPVVWCHTKRKMEWAIRHLAKHHRCNPSDMVMLASNIPKRWLCRYRYGIYRVWRDIPASAILTVVEHPPF